MAVEIGVVFGGNRGLFWVLLEEVSQGRNGRPKRRIRVIKKGREQALRKKKKERKKKKKKRRDQKATGEKKRKAEVEGKEEAIREKSWVFFFFFFGLRELSQPW